jgi:hypothetical protein
MQAEQRDGIGRAFAPVEAGLDRPCFLLRRSGRTGDAFGRSRTVCRHHGRRGRGHLCPLARHGPLVADRPRHAIGKQSRTKTAALADCGHRRHRLRPVRVAVCVCRQFDRGRHLARSGGLAAGDVQRRTSQSRRLVRGAGHRSLDCLRRHFPRDAGLGEVCAASQGSDPRRPLSTERC